MVMSDADEHDLEAFDAMVPVIIRAVPQDDVLAASRVTSGQ